MEKRGRGRPAKSFEEKRVRVNFTLAPDVIELLEQTGNASRTIDDLVRRFLSPETAHTPDPH